LTDSLKARLLLVMLCLSWGLTWPAMRLALVDFPPFTMRAVSALIGAAAMFAIAALAGRPVRIPPRDVWPYIFIVSFFTIIVFAVCVAFAQLHTMTGRVAIIVYTMPIWTGLLSWWFLGERPNAYTAVALALCCAGMATLIYPLATSGIPLGIVLALTAAVSWSIGTIYIKTARKDVEPFTLAAWQLITTVVVISAPAIIFDHSLDLPAISWEAWAGITFAGLFGSAVAYYLWFQIIRILPASNAALGALSSPVIGLISSIFLLGEIPSGTDVVGFALIFAASFIALLKT